LRLEKVDTRKVIALDMSYGITAREIVDSLFRLQKFTGKLG